jgi:hypothetical protein
LVVLWSPQAQQSDWVKQEIYRFAEFHEAVRPIESRLIAVLLEGDSQAINAYQAISDLKDAGDYRAGAANVDPNRWQRAVQKVRDAIQNAEPGMGVPLAILTITKAQLARIAPDDKPDLGVPTLNELLSRVGIASQEDLAKRYGESRNNWKPFGGQEDIWTILSRLKDRINLRFAPGVHWRPIGERFWSADIHAVEEEARKLVSESLSVIVLDPVGLYDQDLRNRFRRLDQAVHNEHTLVLSLSPVGPPTGSIVVRETVRQICTPMLSHFFDPPIPTSAYASCGINIGDEEDIRRLVFQCFGRHAKKPLQSEQPYTSMRGP